MPNLSYIRKARDLTQQELADKVGFHRATIAQIEVGLKPASLSAVTAFAAALDCKVDDLLREPSSEEAGNAPDS